jgi:uncharacterized protein YkwD
MRRIYVFFLCAALAASLSFVPAQAQEDAGAATEMQTERTGSALSAQEAKEILDFHNKARREVKSPPLEWSEELAAFAQAWAEELARQGCGLRHRPRSGKWAQRYGENIFWASGSRAGVTQAAQAWYSEKKFYKGGAVTGSNFSKIGHYTQMVWRKTKALGCGMARCKNGAVIIVANYDPPGNMLGEKPY